MTEGNPAYGLTSPRVKSTESKGDYEIPQYIQPSAVPAPEETVYEGVFWTQCAELILFSLRCFVVVLQLV